MEIKVEASCIVVKGDSLLLRLAKKICRGVAKATRLRSCRAPAVYT